MHLLKFSKTVREIVDGTPTKDTLDFVKQLPMGITTYTVGFILSGKIIKVLSTIKSFPAVYGAANRLLPQKDYTISLRVSANGKTKTVSKSFPASTSIENAKKNLLEGQNAERIFYEILTTDDFEITFSEYEGTVLKLNDETLARRYFQTFLGLFPFVNLEKETKTLKIDCEFEIKKYDAYRKEEQKQGRLSCKIEIDGNAVGTRGNNFVF